MNKLQHSLTLMGVIATLGGMPLVAMADNGGVPDQAPAAVSEEYPQLSNLPTLYIETLNRVPITSKEAYVPATLRYVDASGVTLYDALEIRGRGNSTWGLPKKPYRLKFSKKQEFLGPDRAKAKSWPILANANDHSLMRNALASVIGDIAGQPFTAAAEFADVVLNGEFLGNYQISDQMEIRKKRVDITEQDEPATADSDITGGYFLEVDGFAQGEPVYFRTVKGVLITVKSPDDDIINNAQRIYIQNHIQKFEDALFSADMADPEKGYRKYVDAETLASWYVATELTGNPDGFWSTYIYKERGDDKIYWGPLWDYDIAFNNCRRQGDISRKLILDTGYGSDLTGRWIRQMWNDPWFLGLIADKWNSMLEAGVEEKVIEAIDHYAELLEESQRLNFEKWSISNRVYDELVLYNSYSDYVEYLKNYIHTRVVFLTQAFGNLQPPKPFDGDTSRYYRIRNAGNYQTVDTDGEGVFIYTDDLERESQEWQLMANGDYFQVINRENGLAITDNAPNSGSTYTPGTALGLADPNIDDAKQLWKISVVGSNAYTFVNKATALGWNNQGGSSADGNPVISWTSDSNNPSKPTRQWTLTPTTSVDSGIDEISGAGEEFIYQVSWSASERTLFIRSGEDLPEGRVELVALSGAKAGEWELAKEIRLPEVAPGAYVVRWQAGGSPWHSTKIIVK